MDEMEAEDEPKRNSYAVPIAIVIAGAFVALSIFLTSGGGASAPNDSNPSEEPAVLAQVTKDDHILGDPNAPIKIVEFVDLECPFCKSFHSTLKGIMDEYGKSGQVAWVFRHFPLTQIHPKSIQEANAAECVAELGGNGAFWNFVDRIFTITPSNNGLDLALLPDVAEQVGVKRTDFGECQSSNRYESRIKKNFADAVASGGDGTPWTILVYEPTGEQITFRGLVSIGELRSAIKTLSKNNQ